MSRQLALSSLSHHQVKTFKTLSKLLLVISRYNGWSFLESFSHYFDNISYFSFDSPLNLNKQYIPDVLNQPREGRGRVY